MSLGPVIYAIVSMFIFAITFWKINKDLNDNAEKNNDDSDFKTVIISENSNNNESKQPPLLPSLKIAWDNPISKDLIYIYRYIYVFYDMI
jgi:hypothetical protein